METMHLEQAYLQVKGDLVWLQKEAKDEDKINLYMQVQARVPGS